MRKAAARRPSGGMSALEVEAIDLFISFVRLLGMPKSVGEIYGLLFASAEPLALDALMQRLYMSKGAASQGLKVLRSSARCGRCMSRGTGGITTSPISN